MTAQSDVLRCCVCQIADTRVINYGGVVAHSAPPLDCLKAALALLDECRPIMHETEAAAETMGDDADSKGLTDRANQLYALSDKARALLARCPVKP